MATRSKAKAQDGIPAFFAGRHVLVTGATGFMGKVLVEKILRCCPDVASVFVVVRAKRGQEPQDRIKALMKLPVFEPLLKANPNAFDKIHALAGETTQVNMGLSEADQRLVQDKVSVVFHLAAALNWTVPLRTAALENVGGTKNMLDFCKGIKNLDVLEYTSTTFCQCGEDVLEEKLYPAPYDPHRLLEICHLMDDATVEAMAKTLYGPHPNCYTYTKALAESLLLEYKHELPLCVIRPAIVVPTVKEPVPGWVDTLNGPMGVLAAAGKGVMRSMMCNENVNAEVFPADMCINAIITATYLRAQQPRLLPDIPVYNACCGPVMETTWGEILELGREALHKYPFEWTLWYPDGAIRTNWWAHQLIVLFFQVIPAYFIDLLLLLCGQKRFMVRVQNKIRSGHDLLAFFTMREWKFVNKNGYVNLWPSLSEQDKQTFFLNNVLPIDKMAYIETAIMGARTYCLKESPGSLKYCRRRLKVQHVIHRACVAAFYLTVAYYLVVVFSSAYKFAGAVLL